MFRTLFAAFATLLTTAATAGTVGLHLGSWHDVDGYNNTNPGAYVRTDAGLTLGTYRNSIRERSNYAGYTWTAARTSGAQLDLSLVAITGYAQHAIPALIPSVRIGQHTRIAVIPAISAPMVQSPLTVHLMVEF